MQLKRELWGIVNTIKMDKDYLIGTKVIIVINFLPNLEINTNCDIPDHTMIRCCVYIKFINPELQHISSEKNVMANMLSTTKYENEEVVELEEEKTTLAINAIRGVSHMKMCLRGRNMMKSSRK